jgi:hypothetical protein
MQYIGKLFLTAKINFSTKESDYFAKATALPASKAAIF